MKLFKEWPVHFCEPFRTVALNVKDDAVLPVDAGQRWAPFPWDNRGGRMTLTGDAAHNRSWPRPQQRDLRRPQLVSTLKSVVHSPVFITSAIDIYEAEVILRGAKEVDLSLQTAIMTRRTEMSKLHAYNYSLEKKIKMGKKGHVEVVMDDKGE